jgi:hypothetical protein
MTEPLPSIQPEQPYVQPVDPAIDPDFGGLRVNVVSPAGTPLVADHPARLAKKEQ